MISFQTRTQWESKSRAKLPDNIRLQVVRGLVRKQNWRQNSKTPPSRYYISRDLTRDLTGFDYEGITLKNCACWGNLSLHLVFQHVHVFSEYSTTSLEGRPSLVAWG